MEVKRKALQEALQKLLPGVDKGTTLLEGADTFIFNDNRIFSYNDNISVSVPFPSELVGAVKAKEFYTLVSKMNDEDLKIAVTGENVWSIKAGSAKAELTLLEASTMDQIKGITVGTEWKALPETFIEGLTLCKFSSNRSNFSGIYVSETSLMSTDEIRINLFVLDGPMDCFWIADSAAAELMGLGTLKEYSLTDSWVHFKSEDGSVFSCKKLADAQYPATKVHNVVAKNAKDEKDVCCTLPARLAEAVDRAATLSIDIDAHPAVRLTIKKEFIEVYGQRSTGKYSEKVAWEDEIDDDFEPVVLYVDYSMIVHGLKRSKELYIKQVPAKNGTIKKTIVFKGERISHLLSTFQIEGKE